MSSDTDKELRMSNTERIRRLENQIAYLKTLRVSDTEKVRVLEMQFRLMEQIHDNLVIELRKVRQIR